MGNNKIADAKQRILFITQDDPFYVRIFFEEFLKNYTEKADILGVAICPTMGKKSPLKLVKQMYDFYGLKDFFRMVWRYAMRKSKGETLNKICRAYSIPVYKTNDINGHTFINYWRRYNLDIIISVAAPVIFKKNLLDLPKWGCINIHHAKLPNYRGMMPNFWQMYNGEKNAGITVHRMNPKIDEGEFIIQREIPINNSESLDNLIKRSKKIGANCVIEVLEIIKKEKLNYLTNPIDKGSYFTFPTKKDVREFRKCGKKIL